MVTKRGQCCSPKFFKQLEASKSFYIVLRQTIFAICGHTSSAPAKDFRKIKSEERGLYAIVCRQTSEEKRDGKRKYVNSKPEEKSTRSSSVSCTARALVMRADEGPLSCVLQTALGEAAYVKSTRAMTTVLDDYSQPRVHVCEGSMRILC